MSNDIHQFALEDAARTHTAIRNAGGGLPQRIVWSMEDVVPVGNSFQFDGDLSNTGNGGNWVMTPYGTPPDLVSEPGIVKLNGSALYAVNGYLPSDVPWVISARFRVWGGYGPLFGTTTNTPWAYLPPGITLWVSGGTLLSVLAFPGSSGAAALYVDMYNTGQVTLGEWHDVIFSYDGLNAGYPSISLIVDGVERMVEWAGAFTAAWPGRAWAPSANPITFGASADFAQMLVVDFDYITSFAVIPAPGEARWTKTFDSPTNVKGIILPGGHTSPVDVLFGGVTRRANDPSLNVPVGAGPVDLVFEFDVNDTRWIGSALGEGPAIIYGAPPPPDPETDVVSVSAEDGHLDIVLDKVIGSVGAITGSASGIDFQTVEKVGDQTLRIQFELNPLPSSPVGGSAAPGDEPVDSAPQAPEGMRAIGDAAPSAPATGQATAQDPVPPTPPPVDSPPSAPSGYAEGDARPSAPIGGAFEE